MFTVEIALHLEGVASQDVVEATADLLSTWYKNGQIAVPVWPLRLGRAR